MEVLAEDPALKLVQQTLIQKRKVFKETLKILSSEIDNYKIYKEIKHLKKLPSFSKKGALDHSYLWYLSRREGESYYCGAFFDKIGNVVGDRFVAEKYRLSKEAIDALRSKEDTDGKAE